MAGGESGGRRELGRTVVYRDRVPEGVLPQVPPLPAVLSGDGAGEVQAAVRGMKTRRGGGSITSTSSPIAGREPPLLPRTAANRAEWPDQSRRRWARRACGLRGRCGRG